MASQGETEVAGPLSQAQLELIDAWWRAANYLSVGQIYLLDNPLLEEPLKRAHIKPRLLGHWGTTPGLNFIYAHLNRVIKARDLDAIYICGPGHGGPGMVANTWLEGTYSELYPNIAQNKDGMRRLFRQFSFRVGFRVMPRPRRRARSTRVASLAIRCRTPMAPPSTIRV
jgi:xylulose-5-phosphate/fructose-6-phosphate phosphoketolase